MADIVAHADILTTGGGRLPGLEKIRRMGEQEQYLVLAGTYRKPVAGKGNWMLLIDLLRWRAWSAQG